MRKSTGIVMAILLLGFGSMMVMANVALKPYQRYVKIGEELTALMHNLGTIKPDSKVFVLGRPADDKRLAQEGFGLLLEFSPSARIMSKAGRMESLAIRMGQEALMIYQRSKDRPLEWIEVKLSVADGVDHRALIRLGADGRLGTTDPRLPAKYP